MSTTGPWPWSGRLAFGALHLSEAGRPPPDVAIRTVHAALDTGIRLIDTADAYCLEADDTGHNERLVASALERWTGPREDVVVATKGGHVRDRSGRWLVDGSPDHLLAAAEASRERLGVESIALYQLHRPDPAVAWSESLAALAQLQLDGVAELVGLSNVDVSLLRTACDRLEVTSVQNELSPYVWQSLPVLEACDALGIAFLVWGPFGGAHRARGLADDPKLAIVADAARQLGVGVHELVVGWLASLSPVVTVIVGASRPESIVASAQAPFDQLDDEVLASLDASISAGWPAAGRQSLARLRSPGGDG
jgi:aryl-alcohol dehydrogenase-like predicted oxidoreductase